jgi:hypothetical protein
MESCFTLGNYTPTCEDIKQLGGVKARFWIGQKPDLASITYSVGGSVQAITLKVGKFLSIYEGQEFKNTAGWELVPNETRNTFTHNVTGILFYNTENGYDAIQNLLINDKLFILIETNNGKIKTYGIDRNPANDADLGTYRGLNISAGSQSEGTVFADTTGVTFTATGEMFNMPMFFEGTGGSLEEAIQQLNSLTD